ncbi:MAG: carboxypeptidase regulatory-like domain-containing protein [Bryobacteraceae bacterium]|nr:carboxypeptidase regulatory-like domain-containing protein [Bryobacteraceae bacterium]
MAILTPALHAQTGSTAAIVGIVTDPTGGFVSRVKVTATSSLTGFARSAETQADGTFRLSALPIGIYTVEAEAAGFQRAISKAIQLKIEQIARVDISLVVGQVYDIVNVEAEAAALKTDDSSTSQVFSTRAIVELPLNGRNFLQIARLGASANAGDGSNGSGQVIGSVNGQRNASNQVRIDGIEVTEFSDNGLRLSPSVDAIQEFAVQKGIYPAEFGKVSGGTVNVAIKGGTNDFHGAGYNFLRNSAMDARNFFDRTGRTAPLRYNQFGGVLGGPVKRNKLFFFGSYEGIRERRAVSGTARVPNAAQRAGDLSGLGKVIVDPLTRVPFAGNRIPTNRIHRISAGLAELWPEPNNPGDPLRNYAFAGSGFVNNNQYIARGDYGATSRDQIFIRYMQSATDNGGVPAYADLADLIKDGPKSAIVGYTRTLTPTLINEARFGYTRIPFAFGRRLQRPEFPVKFNIPGVTRDPRFADIPDTGLNGWNGFPAGITRPFYITQNNFELIDNAMFHRGKHAVKFGVNSVRRQGQQLVPLIKKGAFGFTGQYSGDSLGDFLLGFPQSTSLGDSPYDVTAANYRTRETFLYAQDDWRVSNRLTLNLGLRYEYWGPPSDVAGTALNYNPNTKSFIPKAFERGQKMTSADKNNLAPRFGFAFQPLKSMGTIMRGGYGFFYSANNYDAFYFLPYNPPFGNSASYFSLPDQPTLTLDDPFPSSGASRGLPGAFGVDRDLKIGYVQMFSLNVQQRIAPDTVLEVGYLGNKSTRLGKGLSYNYALPGPGAIQPRRILTTDLGNVGLQTSSSNATYHSLQVQLERQFSKGLLLLSSYAFGKALDDVTTSNGDRGGFQGQDPRCAHSCEKGRPTFDIRQRFTLSAVYQLPFGKGRRFLDRRSRIVDGIAGGWDLSSIFIGQTGQPLTIAAAGDRLNIGQGNVRADYIGGDVTVDNPTINRYFNTDAFAVPRLYVPGNSGRGILSGPGTISWDFSLHKNLAITETHRLQIRAEFFNFPNHTNFSAPGRAVGIAGFGVITGAGRPREVQVALKYLF